MDSLIPENFMFESTLDKTPIDAQSYLVKNKSLTSFIDQQRGTGAYLSSKVIIDAQLGNGSDFLDWKNAYITLPYRYRLTCAAGTASTVGATSPNFFTTPKNCSLIESMRVEQGGRVIVQDSINLSHLVNFVKHNTSTTESINTVAGDIYYPDGEFSESCTASIAGVRNVANNFDATVPANNLIVNRGTIERQKMTIGNNRLTTFTSAAAGLVEQAPFQAAASTTTIATGAGTVLSDTHYLAVIYLRDLSDYFMKHPLSKGGYKFTFTINQASTVLTSGTTTKPFEDPLTLTATSLVGSSTVQPCLANIGGKNCVNSALTGNSTTYTYTLLSEIDTSSDTRQSGVFLWLPSLTLSDRAEAELLKAPMIYRNPYMVNSATYTNIGAQQPVNLQLFSAISNPRALIVIPQFSQQVQTQPSQCSPFNPCPGVTDPLSLIKTQIRVNSKAILPAPINYGWNSFLQNTAQIFTTNGGISTLTSGVINLSKFMNNYRYYAFDLSLTGADLRDTPQLITLESWNNNNVAIDLYVFCLYESDVMFNLADATVQVGR